MGRVSKVNESRIAANKARAAYYYGEVAQAAALLLLREGLYLSVMLDLAIVSGKCKVDSVFGAQRRAMVECVKAVKTVADSGIPVINWKPFGWAASMLGGFVEELEKEELIDGVAYYSAVDMYLRVLMCVVIPALLRTTIETLKGTVELSSVL